MKIKLPVIDLSEVDDEELDNLQIKLDYSTLPVTEQIFYEIHTIRAEGKKYSAVCISGYEWIIDMNLKKLEQAIDKAKHIIINDN